MKKPRVIVNCVANKYAGETERIIEFVFPDGTGGLISFVTFDGNKNRVDIYRTDPSIIVLPPKKDEQ